MARYPQIADAVIHIEPPPAGCDYNSGFAIQASIGILQLSCAREFEFAAFARRKEQEARRRGVAAVSSPASTHGRRRCRASATRGRGALFDGDFYVSPPPARPRPAATNLVFVQSRDGNTVGRNPSALGGGEADKHLIYEGLSRVAADAVLSGRRTIRRGDIVLSVWHPELVALRAALGTAAPSDADRRDAAAASISTRADVQRAGAAGRGDHRRSRCRRDAGCARRAAVDHAGGDGRRVRPRRTRSTSCGGSASSASRASAAARSPRS